MLEAIVAIENALMQINFFAWFDLLRGVMRHGRLHRFDTMRSLRPTTVNEVISNLFGGGR